MENKDREFKEAIFQVAEELIQRPLYFKEREKIVSVFNATSGNEYDRAKFAVKSVTGKNIPETFDMSESGGAINNLANKVATLKRTAGSWGKK